MLSRLYVGTDVSRHWFDVCFGLGPEARVVRYENSPQGIELFLKELNCLSRKAFVCMEHTGGCELALANAVFNSGFRVSVVDGAKVASYRKSLGSAKAKTDAQDARLLAAFCEHTRPEAWRPLPEPYIALRELVRHRENLIDGIREWANRHSKMAEHPLVGVQRKAIVEVLRLQKKHLEDQIKHCVNEYPELKEAVSLLCTIPGIAWVSAVRILAEAGPISNYSSPRQLALAAGLCPIANSSGLKDRRSWLPPYGNQHLRAALFFPSVVSFRVKQGAGLFMARLMEAGTKKKMTVVTAGMRKLAHIVWAVLTHKQPFDKNKM